MDTRFVVRAGPRMVPLPLGRTTIGRSPDREIQVEDQKASRRHAALRVSDDAVEIEDLGSVNGTLVDGRPCLRRMLLQDGARITIGETTFVLEDRRAHPEPDTVMTRRLSRSQPMRAATGATVVGLNLASLTLRAARALADDNPAELPAVAAPLVEHLRAGGSGPSALLDDAVDIATRIAFAAARSSGDASWIDRAFELNAVHGRVLDAEAIEIARGLCADLGQDVTPRVRRYLQRLRASRPEAACGRHLSSFDE